MLTDRRSVVSLPFQAKTLPEAGTEGSSRTDSDSSYEIDVTVG